MDEPDAGKKPEELARLSLLEGVTSRKWLKTGS
jgi:hypothetical protein